MPGMIVEKDPSGRAKCKGCGSEITKDSKRLSKTIPGFKFQTTELYCSGCGKRVLKAEIKKLTDMLEILEK